MEMLGAVSIYHYPEMRKLGSDTMYVRAVQRALGKIGLTENELIAWSLVLRQHWLQLRPSTMNTKIQPSVDCSGAPTPPGRETKSIATLLHEQVDLLRELVSRSNQLTQRVEALEASLQGRAIGTAGVSTLSNTSVAVSDVGTRTAQLSKKRKTSPQTPEEAWFRWYGAVPMLWEDKRSVSRRRFSDTRAFVAYMRLFAPLPYRLDRGDTTFTMTVMEVGRQATASLTVYLTSRECSAKSVGTMLRALQTIESTGALDARRAHFRSLLVTGAIVDPRPTSLLLQ